MVPGTGLAWGWGSGLPAGPPSGRREVDHPRIHSSTEPAPASSAVLGDGACWAGPGGMLARPGPLAVALESSGVHEGSGDKWSSFGPRRLSVTGSSMCFGMGSLVRTSACSHSCTRSSKQRSSVL
uniref:Uncharacterized protein n=1 Tax=Eutreptiella gymnastica TaxID=73025 RepID=A0A7S1HSA1_9EUGL